MKLYIKWMSNFQLEEYKILRTFKKLRGIFKENQNLNMQPRMSSKLINQWLVNTPLTPIFKKHY